MTPAEQERVTRLLQALDHIAYLSVMTDVMRPPEELYEEMQHIAREALRVDAETGGSNEDAG